jgi:hypothetical protein
LLFLCLPVSVSVSVSASVSVSVSGSAHLHPESGLARPEFAGRLIPIGHVASALPIELNFFSLFSCNVVTFSASTSTASHIMDPSKKHPQFILLGDSLVQYTVSNSYSLKA